MGWLDVVNWNLETIKKMSFCNFNTAVWNCRVRLWTNFLLITFDFGVNTNFISDCRVQISVCKDPVMGEYVCVVERFTESFSGEAGEGRKYWNPQTPWPWLPHSGVTKERDLGGSEPACHSGAAGGSWCCLCSPSFGNVSSLLPLSLNSPAQPCSIPSTCRCEQSLPVAYRMSVPKETSS